jgi:hypothetical protein
MSKQEYKGIMTIARKQYEVQVLDGVCYVKNGDEWMTSDEFLMTLPPYEIVKFATVGKMAIDAERRGETIPVKHIYDNLDKPVN